MHNQPRTTISVPAAVLLGVAVTSAVTLAVIIAMQSIAPIRVYEGTTALLASLVALTGTGVIICQAADRVMRRLEQLEERVSAQRVAYLPAAPKDPGVRHLRVAGEQVGLSPEAIAAARALARRITGGPAEAERDAE